MSEHIWAIVPVKPLHLSKSRLTDVLDAPARAALTHRLLGRVLETLQRTPGLTNCLVISQDPAVRALAQTYRALSLEETAPLELNQALTTATRHALAAGASDILVIPSDLPFVTPADIGALLASPARLAICPDRWQQGTNALLVRDPVDFPFSFGPDSLRLHQETARRLGWDVALIAAPGLSFDLDTADDWRLFARCGWHPGEATQTNTALAK